jgi:RNA polymerase sigma-70 factor, ECF subfamily
MAWGPGEATDSSNPGGREDRWRLTAQSEPTAGDALPRQPGVPIRSDGSQESDTAHSRPGARDRREHSDGELLRLHINGDPNAFGELFVRHRDRLWAVAIRTLSDPEDAADALQDAMISAFRRAASFRGDSAVTTWLHRIVVNACLDRMRRRKARPEVAGGDERLLDLIASAGAAPDPAHSTEVSLEVMKALRQLPRDQQVALVLVDMLDYPVADAAAVLGVAEGTVKSRCARGRARLLPRLAHLHKPEPAGLRTAGGSASPGPTVQGSDSGHEARNRFGPGSVLPAQDGGDEET